MNQIYFRDYIFEDNVIREGKLSLKNAMVAETLNPDDFNFTIEFGEDKDVSIQLRSLTDYLFSAEGSKLYGLGNSEDVSDITPYVYGETVTVYHDGELLGQFYVRSIKQTSDTQFQFSCTSVIGILATINHYGGMHSGDPNAHDTFGEIVTDIFNTANIAAASYTIDSEVASLLIRGRLPIDSCRNNLLRICLAEGVSILKNADGSLQFTYNKSPDVASIPDDRIDIQARSIDYQTPATKIVVTEHEFYPTSLDQEVVLYENDVAVTNELVTFQDPCYGLTTTGTLQIVSSNCNYAIVSGTGTLTGKIYTHTTKELSLQTGASGEPSEKSVSEVEVINSSNSFYVAKRLANYYGHAEKDVFSMWLDPAERNYTGQLASYRDRKNIVKTGYLQSMDVTLSAKLKADVNAMSGFAAGPFGSNFIDSMIIWSGNGEGTPERNMLSLNGLTGSFNPSAYGLNGKRVRLVVFSSSPGGQGGENGHDADNGESWRDAPVLGAGGQAGAEGFGLWYYAVDLELGSSAYPVSLGAGGAAGAINLGAGGALSHSSFGSYSSANGIEASEGGYYNIITLRTYGGRGKAGVRGGNGGGGTGYRGPWDNYADSQDGESVTFEGVTYPGGTHGASLRGTQRWSDSWGTEIHTWSCVGGGGGGAAVGAAGSDGADTLNSDSPGIGGNGASVPSTSYPKQTILGQGGHGGHGGGGGGISGNMESYSSGGDDHWDKGTPPASGGTASPGGKGSDGFILILSPVEINI